MKTPKERGPDGLWLYETRRARGYRNSDQGRLALQAATGLYIAPSVYAEYESGRRRISDKHRPALVAFWGEPSAQAAAAPSEATLIAALDRHTAAIEKLVERLDRTVNPEWIGECLGETLRALERARSQGESAPAIALEHSSSRDRA